MSEEKKINFEKEVQRLDERVERISSKALTLEESLALYEEGNAIIRKLEEALKQAWKKLDPEGKGYATYDVVKDNLKAQAKALGMPEREPTPEEREQAKKLADPDGTGKVTFENFVKFINRCKSRSCL